MRNNSKTTCIAELNKACTRKTAVQNWGLGENWGGEPRTALGR